LDWINSCFDLKEIQSGLYVFCCWGSIGVSGFARVSLKTHKSNRCQNCQNRDDYDQLYQGECLSSSAKVSASTSGKWKNLTSPPFHRGGIDKFSVLSLSPCNGKGERLDEFFVFHFFHTKYSK